MRIMYVGDIMGKPGRQVVTKILPKIREKERIDVVIAQAENVSHGKGMTDEHMLTLQKAGVDIFSGGNHTLEKTSLYRYLEDDKYPVIRPANMSHKLPGKGWHVFNNGIYKVLAISILGETFPGSHYETNPLKAVDEILKDCRHLKLDASIVNFHGDFSSQKRIIGYYLDGRVSAVIGDHWHVPTADAMILPKGSAHISDVGMCGTLHSSLGIDLDSAISRWRDDSMARGDIINKPPYQFNAVVVEASSFCLAKTIKPINLTLDVL